MSSPRSSRGAGSLRVVVTGLAATYPYGGVFWDYVQYPLGLSRLGHDVLYLEDSGLWCYDRRARTFVEHGGRHADLLGRRLSALTPDLADHWFYRDATGDTYGRSWAEVVAFCREADLFVHLSASCRMREEYHAAGRVVFVDTDPMYTQASVPDYLAGTVDDAGRARVDMLRGHDVFFTLAENVGAADCLVPTGLFDWQPTRQPVVLECFRAQRVPVAERRRVLTTVASWETSHRPVVVDGVEYRGKGAELERFVDLPTASPLPLALALNGEPPIDRLRAAGWRLDDPDAVSGDPWRYRRHLATSLGEWSVAKDAYVRSRSGWFSCRTACYLALGVPAVVQSTGFERALPVGEGLLTFHDIAGAVESIECLARDPHRHAAAAAAIAREYFDSDKVLTALIDAASAAPTHSPGGPAWPGVPCPPGGSRRSGPPAHGGGPPMASRQGRPLIA